MGVDLRFFQIFPKKFYRHIRGDFSNKNDLSRFRGLTPLFPPDKVSYKRGDTGVGRGCFSGGEGYIVGRDPHDIP